jgi:hypothetical protein
MVTKTVKHVCVYKNHNRILTGNVFKNICVRYENIHIVICRPIAK